MTPGWPEMTRVFGRIGLLSFGGPAAQIGLMHRELVEARPWLDDRRFAAALSFCMMLPGPEAMQLATYCGWRLRGTAGGLLAGALFVVPGALVIFALAALYLARGDVPAVRAAFLGVQAAVLAVVLHAMIRLSRRTLTDGASVLVAALAFAAIFALHLPFPVIVGAAALWGLARRGKPEAAPAPPPPGAARESLRAAALWGAIWLAPLGVLALAGPPLLWEIGAFFARLAIVTFGGAYAVLAYMAQEAVIAKGWLSAGQMIDALGLAETTPGPLILVTQFVAILAGAPGGWGMGFAAGIVALHATFAPCFLWIFAGAPWLETITARPRLRGALDAVMAAVVGVIANLALWFGAHVLFDRVGEVSAGPVRVIAPAGLDPVAAGLALLSCALLLGLRLPLWAVLGLAAGAALALHAAGLA